MHVSPLAALRLCFCLLLSLAAGARSHADVILNELVANSSERLLQWDANGVPQVGTGPRWYQAAYNDAGWQTGQGPFGYGTLTNGPTAIATNLQTAMQYLTPTVYLRKSFAVSAGDAARPDAVQLVLDYNDGFVAYLNGVEIARRNGGPANKLIYHDQPAYNREIFSGTATIPTTTTTETISVGTASARLVAGTNVLAIHALNAYAADANFYAKADLRISGAPVVNLVNFNDAWKYFPGVVEPSGNLFDPAQLGSGRQNVPWGLLNFDDSAWSIGGGPFGFGSVGTIGTNVQAALLNVTPSLYQRVIFNATTTQAADTLPLKLLVSYDDGFVAYLNGVEVARRRIGVPNTFTRHDAVADGDASVQTETITIDVAAKVLVSGANVLAIQTHNYTAGNADFLMKADLQTNAGVALASNNGQWKYLAGVSEPVPNLTGEEDPSGPEGPDSANDWVELYNNDVSPVNLTGWHLTDKPGNSLKWSFPNVTIPAGGYLVVICDGADVTAPVAGGFLHASFKLSASGDYLALTGPAGALVSALSPAYPKQYTFQSYARDGSGNWKYCDTATPGAANAGTFFNVVVATPAVSVPGRFYSNSTTVNFTCATTGATIRYTTDGSEPTATSPAATSLTLSANTALRLRAFLTNYVPSQTVTHTYLIARTAAQQSLPAFCLTGDSAQAFYRPFGVFAIVNNNTTAANGPVNYTGAIWSSHPDATTLSPPNTAENPSLYNAPMQSGKPAERPIGIEILHTDATPDLRNGAFIRCAGSPYSRQRYILAQQNNATPNSSRWSVSSTEKPQINLFFRNDVGSSPLQYPLVPGSTVSQYENIRLRAGKNDISNPFIRDEYCRRLMLGMGQVTVRGEFVNVYINSVFKGFFNICERPREPWFQQARNSDLKFDVRNITAITDGDTLAYNELVNFAKTHATGSLTDYQGLQQRVDVVNIADYIILNAHAAMADWPGNNYVMDRERSTNGLYRFSVWDGEGGYGGFSRNPAYKIFNDIRSGSVSSETIPAKLLYTTLAASPEWRLLFADRIQKHFFNGGVLTDANLQSLFTTLAARVQPIMTEVLNQNVSQFMNIWLNGQGTTSRYTYSGGGTTGSITNCPSRRTALFTGFTDDTTGGGFVTGFFVSENLWPATLAPTLSQFGGTVGANFMLTMGNPNGTGTIYYTTNGADPRAVGGGIAGTQYTGAIPISQSTQLKARVRNSNGEWSPLVDPVFTATQAVQVLVTEIMYHPPSQAQPVVDGDEFEFIELKNAGSTTVNLNGWSFTDGIAFTFPANATLAPGAFAVVAKNAAQFATKYPNVPVAGSYGPNTSLKNSGETVILRDVAGNVIVSVTYGTAASVPPWPGTPDGSGFSLVPVNPNSNPNPDNPSYWRASANVGGSPGADDPTAPTPPLVLSEFLATAVAPQVNAIEIFNPTAQPVDCGNWWLSDTSATPKKFRIPANTIIAAGGYLVIDESAFNAQPGLPGNFALSASGGTVALNSGDASGNLTGYSNIVAYAPASPGVSVGPVLVGGATRWLPLASVTLGTVNAGLRVGPIVITEIMYNYPPPNDDFLELCNITSAPVLLFDPANPANTWRIAGLGTVAPDEFYTLPQSITIAPRQIVLFVPNSITPAAFRMKYGIPSAVPIYSYPGTLSNAGERTAVQMPLAPVNGQPLAYVDVDAVTFDDTAPWPTSPDGSGPSLERINWFGYADDSSNWRASVTTGGNPGLLPPTTFSNWQSYRFTPAQIADPDYGVSGADPDRDGLTNFWEFAYGLDPLVADAAGAMSTSFVKDGADGPFLTLQFRRNTSALNLEYHVDAGPSLSPLSLDGAVMIGTPVNNGDGTETILMRDTITPAEQPQRFIRLRVLSN